MEQKKTLLAHYEEMLSTCSDARTQLELQYRIFVLASLKCHKEMYSSMGTKEDALRVQYQIGKFMLRFMFDNSASDYTDYERRIKRNLYSAVKENDHKIVEEIESLTKVWYGLRVNETGIK